MGNDNRRNDDAVTRDGERHADPENAARDIGPSGSPQRSAMTSSRIAGTGTPAHNPPPRRVTASVSSSASSAEKWAMGSASVEP